MFKENYKWQHDYARLVFDTGFCFESCKSDNFDKNKINFVDIDRLIEDRDFGTIEKFIPSITKFVLDPEQAQILDVSFVKTFRLSQLSIQYLQFCKKYLDNTLVIIREECKKVKEENKELNLFVDDLKEHIAILMREIDEKTTFKCEQCSKVFSSQEFLNSHIKRRHSFVEEAEADKLQMEIKELKGRLNSAEKMIQKEQNHEVDTNVSKEVESKKIEELQQKFEDLRVQVQSELKILQAQNNFQEKYEKLFEKMTLQSGSKSSVDRSGAGDVGRRRESTTQTDLEAVLHQASSNVDKSNFEEKNKENIPEFSNAQKQIIEFEEALETKVTSSLEKIENQMQSFWDKLNGMEMQKKKCFSQDSADQQSEASARARVKRSIKRVSSEEDDTFNHKKINSERDVKSKKIIKVSKEVDEPGKAQTQRQMNASRPERTEKVESGIHMTDLGDDDTTTSETIASETEITAESPEEESVKPPPKPLPAPRKRSSLSSAKKNSANNVIDEELLQHFKIEVERVVMGRLQDLGVSPDWKGLPTRSFQRALEIVNHQANLLKKTYPKFDFISSQIEKNVDKKLETTKTKPRNEKKSVKTKPKKVEVKKLKANTKKAVPSPRVEIKDRKMYDTDSESEVKPTQVKESLKQFSAPYSAVIAELKTVTAKIEASDKSDAEEENLVKTGDQTKGVLKNYPSIGSLTKKKVLFNLDTDDDNVKDISFKDGGSSTSIASSVLDGTPRKNETKKEKDIEDLSDFDFSDM